MAEDEYNNYFEDSDSEDDNPVGDQESPMLLPYDSLKWDEY